MLISREPLGRRGRSTLTRGVAALLVAPFAAALPVSLLLVLLDLPHLPDVSHPADLVRDLYGLALELLRLSLPLGLLAWVLLRALRRESALTYGLAGAAEGLLVPVWASYAFTNGVRADQLPMIATCGVAGVLVAVLFWLIAREPPP